MKVCWTSDWSHRPVHTGFSRYSRHALEFLRQQGHEVVEVAVGYEGHGDNLPWKTYPTTAFGGRLEGQDVAPLVAASHDVDVLVLFMDPPDVFWATEYVDRKGARLREDAIEALDRRRFALAMYCPVDGYCANGRPPEAWAVRLRGVNTFDGIASPSRFGATQLSIAAGRPVQWIPHGVDTQLFHPLSQQECRQHLGLPLDRFTLLYVSVNKRRKQQPAFYEIVAKFQERRPDVPLTVIMHGEDRPEHYDLQALVDAYGIEARGALCYRTEPLTDAGLAVLYNAADVFVGPTGGEGFFLPPIEAMACRVPALVTDYSSASEVVPDAEGQWCKIPVKALIPQPYNGIAWAWPDTDAAADRLVAFWDDRALRVRLRRACWEHATSVYALERVLPKMEEFLSETAKAFRARGLRVRVERIEP
jgi:glycosyltransferase involved in cell wall biosynthesis